MVNRITLDMTGLTGMGRGFGAVKDPDNELNKTYMLLFKPNVQAQLLVLPQYIIPGWLVNLLRFKCNLKHHPRCLQEAQRGEETEARQQDARGPRHPVRSPRVGRVP